MLTFFAVDEFFTFDFGAFGGFDWLYANISPEKLRAPPLAGDSFNQNWLELSANSFLLSFMN